MTIVIKIAGKARQVFKLINLLTMYRGEDTIGKIVEEKKQGVIFLPCRESQFNTALTGLQVVSRYRGTSELQKSHKRRQKMLP
jgi:hypothetical protein